MRFNSLEAFEPPPPPPAPVPQGEEKEPPIEHPAGVAFKLQSIEEQTPNDLDQFRFPSPNSEEEISPRIVPLDSWRRKEDSRTKEGEYEILPPITYKYVWKQAGYTTCSATCLGKLLEILFSSILF